MERRAAARRFLHLWAVSWRNGSTVRDHVIVTDISTAGFRMRGSAHYPVDDVVFLEFAYGLLAEARVVWRNEHTKDCGCRFVEPLADSLFARIVARSDTHELTSAARRGPPEMLPACDGGDAMVARWTSVPRPRRWSPTGG